MKLLVKGHVNDRGKDAEFSSVIDDLSIGKKTPLAVQDVYLQIKEVSPYVVDFLLIRFETVDKLHLRRDEKYEFTHRGNAYEYRLEFSLED